MNKTTNISEKQIQNIINETVSEMKTDRHREGYWKERWENQKNNNAKADRSAYWKERWAKQKAEKSKTESSQETKPKKKASGNKDRHRKGYYHDYNQAHPERLDRGFTKGYKNGNVSDGPEKKHKGHGRRTFSIGPWGGYYYDNLGWLRNVNTLTDQLLLKQQEWHDDDWVEND